MHTIRAGRGDSVRPVKQRLFDTKYAHLDEHGQIRLARALGPVCDVHAHLALSYVKSGQVDLDRDVDPEVYLDPKLPLDLDAYMNQNFDAASMNRMKLSLSLGSLVRSGMRATHTAPALERSMKRANIQRSLILAIDLPFGEQEHAEVVEGGGEDRAVLAAPGEGDARLELVARLGLVARLERDDAQQIGGHREAGRVGDGLLQLAGFGEELPRPRPVVLLNGDPGEAAEDIGRGGGRPE